MVCAAGSRPPRARARPRVHAVAFIIALVILVGSPDAGSARMSRGAQEPTPQVRVPRERLEQIARAPAARTQIAVFDTSGLERRVQIEQVDELALQRGQFAVVRTGGAPATTTRTSTSGANLPREALGEWNVLPYAYFTPDATGTGTWHLRPIYKVASRLAWDSDAGVFRGTFFLAIEDTLRLDESRPLPAPIRFQLLSEADTIEPEPVVIEHTNFPLQRVRVVARSVNDSMQVHVVPQFDVRGIDVWIPVAPTLVIDAPAAIQGMGIQQARIVVRVVGASTLDNAVAGLTATAGALDTLELPIGRAGAGRTRLRSEGLSGATLVASAPGFAQASTVIDFTFPWIFLLAALLGGVFGGVAAAAASRKPRHKTRWADFALKGVLAGVLAALAWYALGINLLEITVGVPRFNELAVFTFAALAGYFGIPRPKQQTAEG